MQNSNQTQKLRRKLLSPSCAAYSLLGRDAFSFDLNADADADADADPDPNADANFDLYLDVVLREFSRYFPSPIAISVSELRIDG